MWAATSADPDHPPGRAGILPGGRMERAKARHPIARTSVRAG